MKNSVYDIVTEKLIERLEKGVIPWRKTWNASAAGMPSNLVSKKAYRGINSILLACEASPCPYYVSFNQCKELGGSVKKGASGKIVTFFKILKFNGGEGSTDEGGEVDAATGKRFPLLRYYRVFNALEDCEGLESRIPAAMLPGDFNPIANAEKLVTGYTGAPSLRHQGGVACYSPGADQVTMPAAGYFDDAAAYYATLFHELAHSTGHLSRLNRPDMGGSRFGSDPYAREELVAEMAASMLCGVAGIDAAPLLDNSAAYLGSWIGKLKGDSKLAVQAASAAQRAADWIQGQRGEVSDAEPVQAPEPKPARKPKPSPAPSPAPAPVAVQGELFAF